MNDFHGNRIFNTTQNDSVCQDPEILWKSHDLASFGIKKLYVRLMKNDTKIKISKSENMPHWEKFASRSGNCYTLTIPKNLTENGITLVMIKINSSFPTQIFIHSKGIFDQREHKLSLDYTEVQPTEGARHMLTYQQSQVLNFGN